MEQKRHLATKFEIKSFERKEEEDGAYGYFKGYGSVFNNTDNSGDIIAPGAFSRTLKENGERMPLLWQHDMYDVIGSVINASEDAYGLKVESRLNLNTTRGKDAYALIKAGDMDGLSIGFYIRSCEEDFENDKRTITDIELMEMSVVTMPANRSATIAEVKSMDAINQASSLAEIETLLRKQGFSKNEATAIVAKTKKFDPKQSESAERNSRSESDNIDAAKAFAEAISKLNQEIRGN